MKALVISALALAFLSFQNCSNSVFSSSDDRAAAQNVNNGGPGGVVPEFGQTLDCNTNFADISDETRSQVACLDSDGAEGLYICRIPLDGNGQVETLCLTPEAAFIEVSQACVCETQDHGKDCKDRHDHIWSWFDQIKDRLKDKARRSGDHSDYHDDDSDSESSDEDSESSDDDSNSSDDDSHDHDPTPEICVPSETVQYRLGNCAELF